MQIDTGTIADLNMQALSDNPYPGRGIVIGRNKTGDIIQIYWIMGRSKSSRNRVFGADGRRVYTEIANPAIESGNTDLTIYAAMDSHDGNHVVTNGKQTDDIMGYVANIYPRGFERALANHRYEPDPPNFTPRISAICKAGNSRCDFIISIIRKSASDMSCERILYHYEEIPPGFGRCITTYCGDGDPLPPFLGEPLLVPIEGEDIDSILEYYWDALNDANKVSLAVKVIRADDPLKVAVTTVNKYKQVAA